MNHKRTPRPVRLLQVLLILLLLLILISPAAALPTLTAAPSDAATARVTERVELPNGGRPLALHLGSPEPEGDDSHEPFVEPPPPEPQLPERPPVMIEVSAEPAEAKPGDLITVTVRIEAKRDVPEPRLTGLLPQGLDFEAAPGDEAAPTLGEGKVDWALGGSQRAGERAFRFHLRLREDAPDLMKQRVQLWAAGYEGAAEGEVIIKRLFPLAETRITPEEGGELRSADGRVRVIFPAGTTAWASSSRRTRPPAPTRPRMRARCG